MDGGAIAAIHAMGLVEFGHRDRDCPNAALDSTNWRDSSDDRATQLGRIIHA
jgi:hypothetical protein